MWLIPLLVEVRKALVLEGLELLFASDKGSACVVGVSVKVRE